MGPLPARCAALRAADRGVIRRQPRRCGASRGGGGGCGRRRRRKERKIERDCAQRNCDRQPRQHPAPRDRSRVGLAHLPARSHRRRRRNPPLLGRSRPRSEPVRAVSRKNRRDLAERPGFEPGGQFYPTNRLAGGCLRPLGHLSAFSSARRHPDIGSARARSPRRPGRLSLHAPVRRSRTAGGGGRIRTHGPFGHPVSSGTPSTTRPPLRRAFSAGEDYPRSLPAADHLAERP